MSDFNEEMQRVWRDQPASAGPLSTDEVRTKASAFEKQVLRGNWIAGLLFAVFFLEEGWDLWKDQGVLMKSGHGLLIAALIYAGAWFYRHRRAVTSAAGRGAASCVEAYRAELVRQRNLSRSGVQYLLPFVPGLLLIIFARGWEGRSTPQIALLLALACGLFASCVWVNARRVRKLEREITSLD